VTMCAFFSTAATAATDTHTLSLHDALPICDDTGIQAGELRRPDLLPGRRIGDVEAVAQIEDAHFHPFRPQQLHDRGADARCAARSEEHTSELQSPDHLVCRLLLEKKKQNTQ